MKAIMILSVILAYCAVALSNGARAQEPMKGIGVTDCQTVIDLRGNSTLTAAVSSWAYGFFSAFNFQTMSKNYTMRDLSGPTMEPDALADRIIGRCLDDPKKPVMAVAFDLFNQLPFIDVSNNQ